VPRKRAVLTAIGGALVGAAGWYLLVRKSHEEQQRGPVGRTGRVARSVELALMAARAGTGFATHRARLAVVGDGERRVELEEQFQLRTAEQVADALGNMKGALMKLGQMASYLDPGVPEPVRDALAQLQASAPPMAPELAVDMVERELGAPIDRLFATWEEQPLAAASIGQVHRAVTADGREVAVKVQYPGVDVAIKGDLENTGPLLSAWSLMLPGFEPGPVAAEITARLTEELDYVTEAANQTLFAEFYAGHPFIHIPDVVPELSTGRVLTTALAGGARFDVARTWSAEQRDLAAEAIYRFVFRSFWHLHAFNGDPHPGNYLFEGDGRVTFLDFGLVKRFQPPDLEHLRRMLKAYVVDHDIPEFRRAIEASGFLRSGADVSEELLVEYNGHWYDYILEDEPRTITPEWSSESLRRYFDPMGPFGPIIKASNVPPQYVVLQRINLGLFAVLGELRATRNWRRIIEEIWPWFGGPPSTPLGEAEADWWRSRGHHAWDDLA
jgi:predicted unusual protein kinase regulating ubiquinone biosynthesis (AarF/ABC1/UbiB family)